MIESLNTFAHCFAGSMLKPARQLLSVIVLATAILTTGGGSVAHAQYNLPPVGSMDNVVDPFKPGEVGVDEKLGSTIPTSTTFVDETGTKVTLGDYLHKDRPVILWMGYYECPMLCDKMSAGMVDAVKRIQLDAGKEFSILNVSIDPNESSGLAKAKKQTYLSELGQPGNAAAWNLLTGSPETIKTLADAVGYKFKKIKVKDETQYAHPAVLMILSPEGKLTRYLYPVAAAGVTFDPRTMQLSLIEASEGRIGSIVDRVILTCLHYDVKAGAYTKNAVALMKLGGGITILVMGLFLIPLWIKSARMKPGGDDDVDAREGQSVTT